MECFILQTFTLLTAGDWLMFLAHYWRSQGPGPLPQAELMAAEEANTTQTELAIWYLAIQYYNYNIQLYTIQYDTLQGATRGSPASGPSTSPWPHLSPTSSSSVLADTFM